MTVSELIGYLQECDADAEVRIMMQENWPFECAIRGVPLGSGGTVSYSSASRRHSVHPQLEHRQSRPSSYEMLEGTMPTPGAWHSGHLDHQSRYRHNTATAAKATRTTTIPASVDSGSISNAKEYSFVGNSPSRPS